MKTWILSITVAALLVCVSQALIPEGPVKRAARLLGGLVLMLSVLQPLVGFQAEELYWEANGAFVLEVNEDIELQQQKLLKTIIEDELRAYVLDKAKSLGCDPEVAITCVVGPEGVPRPDAARITGSLHSGQKAALVLFLRDEIGIVEANQTYDE